MLPMGSVILKLELEDSLQFREPLHVKSIDNWKGLIELWDDS